MRRSINIKIGGYQGEGIDKTGIILSKFMTRLGFYNFGYREYQSVIKGGHSTYQIHVGHDPVYSQIWFIDLLIALNKDTILNHQSELTKESLIIYDPQDFKLSEKNLIGQYLPIPLLDITKKAGGLPIMSNMTAMGVLCWLLRLELKTLEEQIADIFADKGLDVIKANFQVVKAGFDYMAKVWPGDELAIAKPKSIREQVVLFGNEAMAAGAVAGGMQFFAAYPMTPSSSILHFLAAYAKPFNLVVKHAEDEIAAVNMAVGASYAGVRSMTATSGGGFCLMTEALGLAGITETPLVIVLSQRPGPALGMPTSTSQSDLEFAITASQDEFPRIVLAPGDHSQAFVQTKQALELAEKYQLPVIIMADKFLSESISSCPVFPAVHKHQRYGFEDSPTTDYLRYKLTTTGISKRTIPGQKNGFYLCNSYAHDQYGLATEKAFERKQQMDKRALKLEQIFKEIPVQSIYGNQSAKIGIICWGSVLSPVRQALVGLPNLKVLHLNWVWPFPTQQVADFVETCNQVALVENNSLAQLGNLIKKECLLDIKSKLLKYNGLPFYPEEITNFVKTLTNGH
jgi:2-oxoglutarate ferredoxin oxidoreductase subunit alpha